MTARSGASDLDPKSFASRFFDKPATGPLAIHLRAVALGLDSAKTHPEMADISNNLGRHWSPTQTNIQRFAAESGASHRFIMEMHKVKVTSFLSCHCFKWPFLSTRRIRNIAFH